MSYQIYNRSTGLYEPFTGTIVTVGAGQDYEDINAAISAAPNLTLFLMHAGAYSIHSFYSKAAGTYAFKAVEDGVVINLYIQPLLHGDYDDKIVIFEGLELDPSSYHPSLGAYACEGNIAYINRCIIKTYSCNGNHTGLLSYFSNCTWFPGLTLLKFDYTEDLSGYHFTKCVFDSFADRDTPTLFGERDYKYPNEYTLQYSSGAKTFAGGSSGQWSAPIDLGDIYHIDRIDFYCGTRQDGDLVLSYGIASGTWIDNITIDGAGSEFHNTSGMIMHRLFSSTFTARYVRFWLSGYYAIREFDNIKIYTKNSAIDLTGYGVDYGDFLIKKNGIVPQAMHHYRHRR